MIDDSVDQELKQFSECLYQFSEINFNKLRNDIDTIEEENKILKENEHSFQNLSTTIQNLREEYANFKIENIKDMQTQLDKLKRQNKGNIDRLASIESNAKQKLEKTSTYSETRGILAVMNKEERKSYHNLKTFSLREIFQLEEKIQMTLKKNQKIESDREKFKVDNLDPIICKYNNMRHQRSNNLEILERNNNRLEILRTEWINQLIIRKCLPYAKDNNIYINDGKDENEDDNEIDGYDELLEKCILHYADDLVFSGDMTQLCNNPECNGVEIGLSCNCGRNQNIWFTTVKPQKYEKFITVIDTFFLPEINRPIGYLILRDSSSDEYIDYAEENSLGCNNYDDLFIECNIHHYNFLLSSHCIPCNEFPKSYGYDDDKHSIGCVFYPNGGNWHCRCGRGDFVFEYDDFNPRKHSIKCIQPAGYLRNAN